MNVQTPVIYQSGQLVPTTGMYEVVGTNHKTKTGEFAMRLLNAGEQFPNLEGRSVAWHGLDAETARALANNASEIRVPAQN